MRRDDEMVYFGGAKDGDGDDDDPIKLIATLDAHDRVIIGGSCRSGNSFDVNFSTTDIFVGDDGGRDGSDDGDGATATRCGAGMENDRLLFFTTGNDVRLRVEGCRRAAALVAVDATAFSMNCDAE